MCIYLYTYNIHRPTVDIHIQPCLYIHIYIYTRYIYLHTCNIKLLSCMMPTNGTRESQTATPWV